MRCELTPVLAETSRRIIDNSADMTCADATLEDGVRTRAFDVLLPGAVTPAGPEPSRHLLPRNPHLKIVRVARDRRGSVLQERRFEVDDHSSANRRTIRLSKSRAAHAYQQRYSMSRWKLSIQMRCRDDRYIGERQRVN